MLSLLAKRLSPFFPSSYPYPHRHHPTLVASLLRLSFSTQTSSEQKEEPLFMAKYLASSWGFSPNAAIKISNSLPHFAKVKSSDQPDSVVRFLTDFIGLSDSETKDIISFQPHVLVADVETYLKPKVQKVMDSGISRELLIDLILYNPKSYSLFEILRRLRFWAKFCGNDCEALLKTVLMKVDHIFYNHQVYLLFEYDVDSLIPRIKLFREYGLSNEDVLSVIEKGPRSMNEKPRWLRQTLDRIEGPGLARGSKMFQRAVRAISLDRSSELCSYLKLVKSAYGWSHKEAISALEKFPSLLSISEDKITANLNFLTGKAKMEPKGIASRRRLLAYSRDEKLLPRHHVLSILAARGLNKNWSLSYACYLTEKKFLEKFVEPYKKDVPELSEAYLDALAGKIPAFDHFFLDGSTS